MSLTPKQAGARTYRDYVQLPGDERWELVDGVIYSMTRAPSTRHQELVGAIFRQLGNALEGKPCRAFVAPFDVRLPEGDEPDDEVTTVVQPDFVVVCDRSKVDDRGCRGAPDFVIEVVSHSTGGRDQIVKARLYERNGVAEYWVIHPWDRLVYIRRLGPDGTFGNIEIVSEGSVAVAAVPGLVVDLDAALAEGWGA